MCAPIVQLWYHVDMKIVGHILIKNQLTLWRSNTVRTEILTTPCMMYHHVVLSAFLCLLFFICACFSGSLIPKAWHLYVNKITIFRWGAFWKKKKDHSVRSQQTMNVFVYTRMCCFVFMISKHLYLITKHIFIDLEWFTEIQPEFIPCNSLELHKSTGIWVKPVMIKVTGVLTCLSGLELLRDSFTNMAELQSSKVCGEITYQFPNFGSYTVEVWVWINDCNLHIIMDVITHPCWD